MHIPHVKHIHLGGRIADHITVHEIALYYIARRRIPSTPQYIVVKALLYTKMHGEKQVYIKYRSGT